MLIKYQHVERFGNVEVEGIEFGECYIFPKIDGTNASVWIEGGEPHFGSRKRELEDSDNAGFKAENLHNETIMCLLENRPELRLYGEWLVPHSLKTYAPDAWRKFYVFDVCTVSDEGGLTYLPYDEYSPLLDKFGVEYIPPIAVVKNPSYERLVDIIKQNNYLMDSPDSVGEGIVVKRYDFKNRFGKTVWAKIVTADFKAKHIKAMGPRVITEKQMVEQEIVDKYLTKSMVEKVYNNISVEQDGWSSKFTMRLLSTVYHDLVIEELWPAIKHMKNPTINFKTLQYLTFAKVKTEMRI